MDDIKKTLSLIAKTIDNHKAEDLVILDISDFLPITDYFVICTGVTQRHVQGIAKELEFILKKNTDLEVRGKVGYNEGKWIILDYDEVVIHIFLDEVRKFYDLEELWNDVPRVKLEKETN